MKHCYLTVKGKPWCKVAETNYGNQIAIEQRVLQCSYTRKGDAEDAAKRLRKVFKRGTVRVVEGTCPSSEGRD